LYLPIPAKFALALTLAIAWTALSVWLSQRWLADLANVSSWIFALIAIGFIAYVPGFMNAFLLGTLLFDRRPPRIRPTSYPPVSVLVAAYNEASGIRDTLASLAAQTYPGSYEVLVLNDGSTDNTVAIARAAIIELGFPPNADVRLLDYTVNAGKAAVLNRGLGAAKNIGGKLKEAAGKLTGDEKLKAEGRADQVAGKVQNAVGGVKDALKGDRG